jgi:hypothetical protein
MKGLGEFPTPFEFWGGNVEITAWAIITSNSHYLDLSIPLPTPHPSFFSRIDHGNLAMYYWLWRVLSADPG